MPLSALRLSRMNFNGLVPADRRLAIAYKETNVTL